MGKIKKMEKIKQEQIIKKDKTKKILKKVFDIGFWVIIIVLASIWVTDFFIAQNDKKPIFCLNEKTHEFEDGKVFECVGLGYKIYRYDRESISISHQFSPIFVGMKK